MSWRHLIDDAHEVILDELAERDDQDELTTEIDEGTGDDPVPVRAIFEDGALAVLLEQSQTVASVREIRADVAIKDLPAYPPTEAWRFRIRRPLEGAVRDTSSTTVFSIYDHQPDGQGLV